ncbi:hypothetical protein ABBQ32_013178 [Trebouxia sp. C0010 RCD-2024]
MQAVQTCSVSPAAAENATIRLPNTVGQRKRTPEGSTTDEHQVIPQTRAVDETLLAYCSEALEMDEGGVGVGDAGAGPDSYYGGYEDEKMRQYDPDLLNSFDSNPKRHLNYAARYSRSESLVDEEDAMLSHEAQPWNADLEGGHDPFWDSEDAPPAGVVGTGEQGEVKRFKRQTRINWSGCTVMFAYFGVLCFYLYIRVSKTLDLGQYFWYGIIVLIVEIMGASTTLLYGVNLLLHPVYQPVPRDESGKPMVALAYHVRVLVPCYKESLEILARTCSAALEAVLPEGCTRSVYLCDDGGDSTKRKWVQSKAAEKGCSIYYVSGRKRSPGEMNGKSANLNNCLKMLYPGDRAVPPNELVCIFDADQVANKDFYTKTLPLFDAGDDVGMVLSPQAFYNLNQRADIFNHSNIHFWEYAQHGYDAIGFISCTGTNFLIRANAFKQAGWSPEYTLTEDYMLGMVLKQQKWHCRYVEEYLAVGEAPEQVRNCFQQRSRWCKGHFQIVLSRRYSPMTIRGLSPFMRIMYCSGVWSYIVGAVTTPLFIIIPLLTIWAGIFPIVISWWAALALTIYYIAQSLVLNYSKKWWHPEALWFANISNMILWFTYVKGAWRALTGKFGAGITFKTTIKGAGRLLDSVLGDLWMPGACFVLSLVSLIYGIKELIHGATVVTTLTISVVWIVYSMIPPYLLIHYTWIGRGTTLQFMCRVAFVLSFATSIAAMLLLWAVYPKDYDFGASTKVGLDFYESQMVGTLPPGLSNDVTSYRGDAFTYETGEALLGKGFGDVTGGWCTGDQVGCVKMTQPTAVVTAFLAWSLLAFPDGYNSGGNTAQAQAAVRWGATYLMKLWRPDTAPGVPAGAVNIIYQVGSWSLESQYWGIYEGLDATSMPRPTYNVSTALGASDLAGDMAAAFAASALVLRESDPAFAAQLTTAAVTLYQAAAQVQGSYTSGFTYSCTSYFAKNLIGAKRNQTAAELCPAPQDYEGGTALVAYNSTSFYDDLLWSSAWLWQLTGEQGYYDNGVNVYYSLHLDKEDDLDAQLITDWDNLFWASNVLLANLTSAKLPTEAGSFHQATQSFLKQWVCGSGGTVKYTNKGRAFNPHAPTIGDSLNTAFISAVYATIPSPQIGTDLQFRLNCWSRSQVRYVLGDAGRSLVSGWGKKAPTHVQDKEAACPSVGTLSKTAAVCGVQSLNSTAPNPRTLPGGVVTLAQFTDQLIDDRTLNSSRVGIMNNVGLPTTSAGLNQASGTWEQCLQGYGQFTKNRICSGSW